MSEDKKEFDSLEFVSQVGQVIEKNFKWVLGLFVAIVVASSVWAYMDSAEEANQREAFAELFKITKIYDEKMAEFEEAKIAKEDKANKETPEEKEKVAEAPGVEATGVLEKDFPEVVPKLEAFIDEHLGTKASGEAALTLSEIYAEYDQYDKAVAALKKTIDNWGSEDLLYNVMQMRAGDLLASQNQCEKALSFWEPISESSSFISSQAKLKRGVCLQEVGRLEEAKNVFQEIKDSTGQDERGMNPEAFSATRYLRYIQFKMKNSDIPPSGKAQQNEKDSEKAS